MTFNNNQNANTEMPPVEKSLKYMAWNVKQIDEHLKIIAESIKEIPHAMDRLNNTLKGIGQVLQSKGNANIEY